MFKGLLCDSKFGKLSSGHRTGKGQFSFQSQREAMPENVQTTVQLHSSGLCRNDMEIITKRFGFLLGICVSSPLSGV